MKIKLDLSNYGTKIDLKNVAGVDTSKLAKKVDLATLKSGINQLNIGKLETTPVDLSKASDVVKNEVVGKTVYDEIVKIVNAVLTLEFDSKSCLSHKNC